MEAEDGQKQTKQKRSLHKEKRYDKNALTAFVKRKASVGKSDFEPTTNDLQHKKPKITPAAVAAKDDVLNEAKNSSRDNEKISVNSILVEYGSDEND